MSKKNSVNFSKSTVALQVVSQEVVVVRRASREDVGGVQRLATVCSGMGQMANVFTRGTREGFDVVHLLAPLSGFEGFAHGAVLGSANELAALDQAFAACLIKGGLESWVGGHCIGSRSTRADRMLLSGSLSEWHVIQRQSRAQCDKAISQAELNLLTGIYNLIQRPTGGARLLGE